MLKSDGGRVSWFAGYTVIMFLGSVALLAYQMWTEGVVGLALTAALLAGTVYYARRR